MIVPTGGKEQTDGPYTFNTTFNYRKLSLANLPSPWTGGGPCKSAAERIIRETGITKGYCLVYGFGQGRLAYELAKRTELIIVGVSEDADVVAKARKLLSKAGLYGNRITVRHVKSLAKLPFTNGFANLIVSEDMLLGRKCPGSAAEISRVLRPGGIARLPSAKSSPYKDHQAIVTREDRPGTGEWTHLYGRADNTGFGGETLSGATSTDELHVQWFGRP
ncbi:MAG: class I SAM-dependent methyltransferase, partial [bacterium]|nr:class I SAM-dependent methyltransferase [bacterium]